jgi:tetratricopeptide (TPR) repeat protein
MYNEAEVSFTKLIDLKPDDADFYFNRANARRSLGNIKGELEDREKCVSLENGTFDLLITLDESISISDADLEDFTKSKKKFKELIKRDPNNYQAYFDLGLAYSKILAHTKAIAFYTESMRLHPDRMYDRALFNRASAHFDNNQFEHALSDIESYFVLFTYDPYLNQIKEEIKKRLESRE